MFTITTNGGYRKENNDDTLKQSNDQRSVHNVEELLEMQIQDEEYTIPST